MKKTNLTKILVLVLSLALLIGTAIAVAVSASEDNTYEIKSINISHEDATKVLVAVDAPESEAANIEVLYTYKGETKAATYYDLVDIYNDGTKYPVFFTEGISAKDMGETVTAEAHVKGSGATGPARDISVATYLYTKLYKEGYAAKTEGDDADRRDLYNSMLQYGADAQEVFYVNKGVATTLVTDYVAVYAEEGNINGLGNFVIFKEATDVEIVYTGDAAFGGWNVNTYVNGLVTTVTKDEDNFTLDESAIITVKIPEPTVIYDFEGTYTTPEKTVSYSGESWTVSEVLFDAGYSLNYSGSANQHGATATVVTEEDGNQYVNIAAPSRVHSKDRSHVISALTPQTLVKKSNVLVLEWSQRNTGTISNFWQIMFKDSATGKYGYVYGGTYFYIHGDNTSNIYCSNNGEWVDMRLEIYNDTNIIKIYTNGVYSGILLGWSATSGAEVTKISDVANIDSVALNTLSSNGSTLNVDVDNIYCYKTYIKESGVAAETFDNEVYHVDDTWTVTSCSNDPVHTESAATHRYFSLASVEHSAIGHNGSISYANVAGAYSEVRTDEETGNKYLYVDVPARVCNRDRGYNIKTPVQKLGKDHTLYILEADINLVKGTTSGMTISVFGGGTAQFNGTGTTGFGGATDIGVAKEWVSIRVVFEFDATTPANNVAHLYVKDVDGNWVDLGAMATSSDTSYANVTTAPTQIGIGNGANNIIAIDNLRAYTAAAE